MDNNISSFLIKEYDYLGTINGLNRLDKIIDLHMAISAFCLGLIPAFIKVMKEIYGTAQVNDDYIVFVVLLILVISILEYILFKRMVELSVRVTLNYRAMNRIRRYFNDLDKTVQKHFSLPCTDTEPAFNLSYKVKCAVVLNSALAIYFIYCLFHSFIPPITLIRLAVEVAILIGCIQMWYSNMLLKKAEKEYVAVFKMDMECTASTMESVTANAAAMKTHKNVIVEDDEAIAETVSSSHHPTVIIIGYQ